MSIIDWIVLVVTLAGIILYGVYKGRGQTGVDSFILAGKKQSWHTVLIGIMATQASAITFISGPGQSFADGMRFVQYYFGLPLAMIVISMVFIPYFQKQNVYTAYQFLDQRFDRKTRLFTGILFLFSRGISTGMSVLAPAIVLAAIFQISIVWSSILIGGFLIIYTMRGGAQAIGYTQKLQFGIIMGAMLLAGIWVVKLLPHGVGLSDALMLAGKSGKMNIVTTEFNLNDKFNVWSGIIGGFFLALSYFGTDQSQVGRYLSGKDIKAARMGILMNGMVKIPMQFLILLIGVLLFAFFTLKSGPIFFNEYAWNQVKSIQPHAASALEDNYALQSDKVQSLGYALLEANKNHNQVEIKAIQQELQYAQYQTDSLRKEVSKIISESGIPAEHKDVNYVFLYFVKKHLPVGIVGLVFAIIFLASWGSISAALNSLASATLMDFHLVVSKKKLSNESELFYARLYTLLWGLFSIFIAIVIGQRMGSLIEAVNELGSLFYGPILGIFLVAFFFKGIKGSATFYAAILAEIIVFVCYKWDIVAFLWLNVVGAFAVILVAALFQYFLPQKNQSINTEIK